jgi:hypothetical protein
LNLPEAIDLSQQIGRRSDLCLHERFELRDLFVEEGHGFSDEAEEIFLHQSGWRVHGVLSDRQSLSSRDRDSTPFGVARS